MAKPKGIFIKPFIFLKETKKELEKANWPSREKTLRLTFIVILVSLIVAAYVGLFDYAFTQLIGLVIKG